MAPVAQNALTKTPTGAAKRKWNGRRRAWYNPRPLAVRSNFWRSRSVGVDERIYKFNKTVLFSDFVVAGAGANYESYNDYLFYHSEIPGISGLKEVFTYVRINRLTWTFTPLKQSPQLEMYNPKLVSEVAHDGNFASSIGYALEKNTGDVVVHVSADNTEPIVVSYKPAVARQFYGGVTSAYGPLTGAWVDLNDDSIPHYGLRMHFRIPSNASGDETEFMRYCVSCTIDFDLKSPK